MKILLVDDDFNNRQSGRADLEGFQHNVMAVASYWQAHDCASGHFDVAILELLMPAVDIGLDQNGQNIFLGHKVAAGWPLLIYCVLNNVKHICLLTNTPPENNPHSVLINWFGDKKFRLGLSEVVITHAELKEDGTKNYVSALARLF